MVLVLAVVDEVGEFSDLDAHVHRLLRIIGVRHGRVGRVDALPIHRQDAEVLALHLVVRSLSGPPVDAVAVLGGARRRLGAGSLKLGCLIVYKAI